MRKTAVSIVLAVLVAASSASAQDRGQKLREHVGYFAADSLHGRLAGSEDAFKAADYIVRQFKEMGLKPFFEDQGWLHRFNTLGTQYRNVVGVIEGNDPELKDEYIVVGAHYDHLGTRNGKIYNGADDNASGCAAVIETARYLRQNSDRLRRSVIIAAFDAEEEGLFGSNALSRDLAGSIGKEKIVLMISADMVGWYKAQGELIVEGVGTISNTGNRIFRQQADKAGIALRTKAFETSTLTATDTEGFARRGIPTLSITTGMKSPYHKPEDDADLIDYEGLDKVTGYISGVIAEAAAEPKFGASGKLARKHTPEAPLFEAGLIIGPGASHISLPNAKVDAASKFDLAGGLTGKFNFGHFGVRTQALYELSNSCFPQLTYLADGHFNYHQESLTIPLSLTWQSKRFDYVWVHLGGFYRYAVKATIESAAPSMTTNRNQWGLTFGAGIKLYPLFFSLDVRTQLNPLFTGTADPDARLHSANLSIGWLF